MMPVGGVPQALNTVFGPGSAKAKAKTASSPGMLASSSLECAVDVGCVAPEQSVVGEFLRWNVEFCELILADEAGWASKYGMPEAQRSTVRLTLAFSKAILGCSELPPSLLLSSRRDAMEAFSEAYGDDWEGISQSQYLLSIQLCLLEPNLAEAINMLNCGRVFDETHAWHGWLKEFIANLDAARSPTLTDSAAIDHFDRFFDRIRDPKAKVGSEIRIPLPLLRLQLAALRARWIDGKPLQGSWHAVLKSIANP